MDLIVEWFCTSFGLIRSFANSVMLFSSLKSFSILTANIFNEFRMESNFSSATNESFLSIFPVYTSVADLNSSSVNAFTCDSEIVIHAI